jgi:hypothetical protein
MESGTWMTSHQHVLNKFSLEVGGVVVEEGQVSWSVKPLGNGNINGTFLVTADADADDGSFVLQEVNHFVFRDVDGLMDNMVCVTDHLKKAGVRTLELVSVRGQPGRYHYLSPTDQTYWRIFKYIPKCKSAVDQALISYQDVLMSAKAFGDFQYQLRNLPVANLKETIPNFHNTRFRYESFLSAVRNDVCGLLEKEGVRSDIEFIMSREEKYVDTLLHLRDPITLEEVPERVVHNDTKISNVLLSEDTGEAMCVIDLDTVMPGRSLYDFADIVRSTASSCGEEEPDCSLVHVRLEMFRAAAEGYLSSAMCAGRGGGGGGGEEEEEEERRGRLWPVEIEHLYIAGQVMLMLILTESCVAAWSTLMESLLLRLLLLLMMMIC